MKQITELQKQSYKSITPAQMIKDLEEPNTFNNLRMVQQGEFGRLKRRFFAKGYLTESYYDYLINLHFNFVTNSFKFKDVVSTISLVKKKKQVKEHIGMTYFKSLSNVNV